MRITRKQTIAVATAAAAIAVLGGTGVAMAANTPAPVAPSAVITTSDVTTPDTAEATSPVDATETVDGTEGSDGADQGPDAPPASYGWYNNTEVRSARHAVSSATAICSRSPASACGSSTHSRSNGPPLITSIARRPASYS